jgi:hypothetical protein
MFRKDKPLPNLKKRESVFALFHDDKRKSLHFVEPKGPIVEDKARSLSDRHLAFELVEPLKE